jgi:nicotinamide riboside transporter PnuC
MMEWILYALSFGGNVLVIKKRPEGFLLWILGNAGWLTIAVRDQRLAQAALWLTYLGFAVWGLMAWAREGLAGNQVVKEQEGSKIKDAIDWIDFHV